jgi:methylenetetrahydrofolate dehydrogenase (NADP+)/methenyltetrahydrofolate cyclohydrolase/formyltetrahydrofolate synthetase
MAAQKIDGTAIAKNIRVRINEEIKTKQRTNPRYKPSLVIIQGILKPSMLNHVLC